MPEIDSGVDNAHELAHLRAFLFELDVSVFLGKQRVVTAATNVRSRVETRTALANDNVAGYDFLAAVDFDA